MTDFRAYLYWNLFLGYPISGIFLLEAKNICIRLNFRHYGSPPFLIWSNRKSSTLFSTPRVYSKNCGGRRVWGKPSFFLTCDITFTGTIKLKTYSLPRSVSLFKKTSSRPLNPPFQKRPGAVLKKPHFGNHLHI